MYELSMTTDFDGDFARIDDIRECLAACKKAGFSHIHWCFEWSSEYMYSEAEMKQLREVFDEVGVKAKSLHATHGSGRKDYTSMEEYKRSAGVELVKNRVALAHELGATEIVLHMYLPYKQILANPEYEEAFYVQIYKSLDELEPYCREKNVRICLENLFEAPAQMQLRQFRRLFDHYSPDFLGLCVDTGHANLVWGSDFVKELVEPFADRIYSVHLHDNKGWGGRNGCGDAHRVPGDPDFPWKEFMTAIRKSAYEMPLNLEVVCHRDVETREAFLKRSFEAGQWLYSL